MSMESMFTRLSATLGNKHDLYRVGVSYYTGQDGNQDFAKAKRCFEKAADKRYPKALYYLGLMHKNGEGVEKDYALAIRYLELSKREEEAAEEQIEELEKEVFDLEKSDKTAELLFKIGYMYANDNAIPKDYEKALHYYKRAASYGSNHAKNQLGLIYSNGRLGTEKNNATAYAYLYVAVRDGFYPAKQTLYKILQEEGELEELLLKVEEGDSDAQNIYASLFYEGVVVEHDLDKAQHYFELAAKDGHLDAIYMLSDLLKESQPQLAQEYFTTATEQGHLEALKDATDKDKIP